MYKTQWKTIKVKLSAGDTVEEKDINLPSGERIVAAVATRNAPAGSIVDLGLYEGGNEVSAPMDLDFWKRSEAGQYLDGFKPLEIKGGQTITARMVTTTALGADVDIELVFGIITKDQSC
jgi:hypothetical protein